MLIQRKVTKFFLSIFFIDIYLQYFSKKLFLHCPKLPEAQSALLPRAPLGLQRIYGSHLLHTGHAEEAAHVLRRVAMEAGFWGCHLEK